MALSRNPFNSLPIETTQHIASFLEYDDDICNFREICRATHNAIDADNFSFWRRRFIQLFEDPGWTQANNEKYKAVYQDRRAVLKNGASFRTGRTRREARCLEVLRDIMVESMTAKIKHSGEDESRNLEHIKRFHLANNLLQIICKPAISQSSRYTASPLLLTIQVLAAPMLLSFERHLAMMPYQFPTSQFIAYSCKTTHPILRGSSGLEVNMEYILHNINFWKYHMTREEEHTLYPAFSSLEPRERPRWWSKQSAQSPHDKLPKLGKHWKGSYAYLDHPDLDKVRHNPEDAMTEQILDYLCGEDKGDFQNLTLHLVDPDGPAEEEFPWPTLFERHLGSLSLPTPPAPRPVVPTRAQRRAYAISGPPPRPADPKSLSFRFDGEGVDVAENFRAAGWLNPLPPQCGVPGWRRMTMMKYFEDDENALGMDMNALWAYEGIVLPGGRIMIGRWWNPRANGDVKDVYSGPFILWCVDGPDEA